MPDYSVLQITMEGLIKVPQHTQELKTIQEIGQHEPAKPIF